MWRLISSFLLIFVLASPARADVNLLSMGDWGTNGDGQRRIAGVMASYVRQGDIVAALQPTKVK